jgi:hypothetical protein
VFEVNVGIEFAKLLLNIRGGICDFGDRFLKLEINVWIVIKKIKF